MVQGRLLFLLFSENAACPLFKKEDEHMHYATLVTVEIEPCEENMEIAAAAGSLIQEIEEQKRTPHHVRHIPV